MVDNQEYQNKEDELRELLNSLDPSVLKKALASIHEPKVRKEKAPSHEPVKHYTKFIKNYNCTTCHSSFVVEDQLAIGESTSYIKPDGSCGQAMGSNKDRITVRCITSHCSCCRCKVKTWSREMLEERFIRLVQLRSDMKVLW